MELIITGARQQEVWDSYEADPMNEDFSDDSDSNESGNDNSVSEVQHLQEASTESKELSNIVHGAIASLFKLSILVQKSSRGGKFAESSMEKRYETQFDIQHVRECFPFAADNHKLLERLGRANAQRRQWLSYRRRHHEKLAADLTQPHGRQGDARSYVATDVPAHSTNIPFTEQRMPVSEIGGLDLGSNMSSTIATTFNDDSHHRYYDSQSVSEGGLSETLYSASGITGFDKQPNVIPRMPKQAANGDPFECPFCFTIQTISGLHSWM